MTAQEFETGYVPVDALVQCALHRRSAHPDFLWKDGVLFYSAQQVDLLAQAYGEVYQAVPAGSL